MKKLPLLFALLPVCAPAQFMKDYLPNGSPLVTSTVNLVSVVERAAAPDRFSRAFNTIQENATVATNDVWVNAVDSLGNVTFSQRYGLPNVDEVSSALIRCPNGDFIYAATTSFGGLRSAWLFRRGAINWSWRYSAGNNNVRSLCIRKTNEAAETYIVAGTIDSDRNLLVFKINAGGNMMWNRRYVEPGAPPNLANVPKSMIIKLDTVIIAGNRTWTNAAGATARDIFAIGLLQTNGNIAQPYRYFDNGGRDDFDPFINFGVINNEYVMTYQTIANIAAVNTGRITFTRLTSALNLAVASSVLYWENNTTSSYGHTIYKGAGTALGYDIGGGTTVGNVHNPLFFTITPTGAIVAGTYRRLWTTLDFISTYMMQDAFSATNRYEHHNWKRANNQNSMSLLRDPSLAAPCNVAPLLNSQTVAATQTVKDYTLAAVITQAVYDVPDTAVHGVIVDCAGAGGVFRNSAVITDEPVSNATFKLYPTILHSGEMLRVQMTANKADAAAIRVYNMQAQVVYSTQEATSKGINLFSIGTNGFKPGSYIVEVRQGNEVSRTKIVVE